jgi:hypothetical protein
VSFRMNFCFGILIIHAVVVTRGLRDNEEARGRGRGIADLMVGAREDPDSTARGDQSRSSFHFHHDLTCENVEKLLSFFMRVADFGRARRNKFFNHAQALVLHEMPSIALFAPAIVFRIFAADRIGSSFVFRHRFFFSRLESA